VELLAVKGAAALVPRAGYVGRP